MATAGNQGATLYYETHGEGPPLVFAHGAGGRDDSVDAVLSSDLADRRGVELLDTDRAQDAPLRAELEHAYAGLGGPEERALAERRVSRGRAAPPAPLACSASPS